MKVEEIGKVRLDLSDYSGQDFYSEGEMENLLLDLVKANKEDEFNKLIAQNQYWSVLYHLSHIRGNIVDFIDLKPGDKVLEVGSGCGAITSTLAKSGANITCIELSKQRSLINAYRNIECDNIEIKVGNYEDIEKHLDTDFDYIFMIGVFEYGGAYISSNDPYIDFLKSLYAHLKQGGSVYMAIENKYGMKYFAGCREDHTGRFYEGIEGYRDKKGVSTFSLNALKKMTKSVGFKSTMMYPYPDYKLPMTVYSDERLPRVGELKNSILNFDNSRIIGFDEAAAFDEVIAENEFDRYSNSFLLKLDKGEKTQSFAVRHIIYSKHSNDRDDSLKIRTDIEKDGYNKLYVMKRPCHALANSHIRNMAAAYEKLTDAYSASGFKLNTCKLKTEGDNVAAEFEYIEGNTLEELLDSYFDSYIGSELDEKIANCIDKYIASVNSIKTADTFEASDEFERIFGKAVLESNQKSFEISNIDLIFSNIFTDPSNTVIDYEWTFDFKVPVSFVIYRALFYYFSKDEIKKEYLKEKQLYKKYGIDESLCKIYSECEHNFQKYIAGNNISLIGFHSIFGQDAFKASDLVEKESILGRKWRICVYYDKGQGFNQEDTVYYKTEVDGDEISVTIPVNGAKQLRIDPTDDPCILKIEEAELIKNKQSTKVVEFMVNGIALADGIVFYKDLDPQIIINNTAGFDSLKIKYSLTAFRRDFYNAIGEKLSNSNSGILAKKKGPYEKIRL